MKDLIRSTAEFKALRAEAREAIAAYEDGADFLFTISRLAAIGERMNILLALAREISRAETTYLRSRTAPAFFRASISFRREVFLRNRPSALFV